MKTRTAIGAATALVVAGAWCLATATSAQAPAADGVGVLLSRLEKLLQTSDASRLETLISSNAAPGLVERFAPRLVVQGATRAIVHERERLPLDGALPGDGYRLVVDALTETAASARIMTLQLDVRRPRGDEAADAWRIVSLQPLTLVEGLYRLEVNGTRQFTARNLTLQSQDLKLTLGDGAVFTIDNVNGTTGLVLIGRGQLEFAPGPQQERDQLRLFAGVETLATPFETAFVRLSPDAFTEQVAAALTPATIDSRQLRRAREIFAAESPRSFSLDLGDLSRDTWYLQPSPSDFLAEVRTRRLGALTYTRSSAEAEDITLFERSKGRDIARYASADKLRARGVFYNEDDLSDYDVLNYDVDATIAPAREFVEGHAQLKIKVRAAALSTINVRLAEALTVMGVSSPELGRLLHIRVRTRDTIVINLPVTLKRGREITLDVTYAGRVRTQAIDQESLAPFQGAEFAQDSSTEPYYLLSSTAYWYPQAPTTDYATATLRVTVPGAYGCAASGELAPGFPAPVPGDREASRRYLYRAIDPVRYLAIVVSRFKSEGTTSLPLSDNPAAPTVRVSAEGVRQPGFHVRDRVALRTEVVPRLMGRGKELGGWAADILRFYTSLIGEAPYTALTVAVVEQQLPGGHAPAHLVLLHNPPPGTPMVWRNDPAAFQDFPEFFMAHEVAHQWWGQAVGWKNYHEQWLSEGLAQYFAALYAQQRHGEEQFQQMLRQFRRWAIEDSDQGPIYLGYRLGQIRGDRRVFRALVYNKGAGVLHMLRRLIGDEAFFNGLRRYYYDYKFEKAGTDDLQRAFEAESGRPLQRFFDRWIYESRMPRVQFGASIAERQVTVRFKQLDGRVFDLPVTVTLTYADGHTVDVVVPVTTEVVEQRIPVEGAVKTVRVNRDGAALAVFDES